MANKIISCGGSVADRYGSGIKKSYGDYLAELLDVEYIHNAKHLASNDRMYKLVVAQVQKEIITKGDLVIFQVGSPLRLDLPGPEHNVIKGILYDYGTHCWSIANPVETKNPSEYKMFEPFYHEQSRVVALNTDFYTENWLTQGLMFQSFLDQHGIGCLPILHRCIADVPKHEIDLFLTPKNKKHAFLESAVWIHDPAKDPLYGYPPDRYLLGHDGYNPEMFDKAHYSDFGHKHISRKLLEHIETYELFR